MLCCAVLGANVLQFLVTRNPSFLQPDPAVAAQQQQGARDSMRRSRRNSSKGAGWWVSAGALFAGVSAVLALAVCYMSAQIWSRYKVREAVRHSNSACVLCLHATYKQWQRAAWLLLLLRWVVGCRLLSLLLQLHRCVFRSSCLRSPSMP